MKAANTPQVSWAICRAWAAFPPSTAIWICASVWRIWTAGVWVSSRTAAKFCSPCPISLNTSLETLERFTGKTAAENAQNAIGGTLNSAIVPEKKAEKQSDSNTVTLQLTSDRLPPTASSP